MGGVEIRIELDLRKDGKFIKETLLVFTSNLLHPILCISAIASVVLTELFFSKIADYPKMIVLQKPYKPIALLIAVMSLMFLMANNNFKQKVQANSMALNQTQVEEKLQTLPDWTTDGETIQRTFKFKDFIAAIDFVNKLVEPAENAGHHPDISISYNKVTIDLTTHDAGGITQKDFDLAKTISELAQP